MKFENLKTSLKENIYPIYLLEGEEAFFREKGEQMIVEAAVSEPQLNFAVFDGSIAKQGTETLVGMLSSCPFMSLKRAVLVSEWYPSAQDLKEKSIKHYLENPYDTAVLIVNNSKKCEALKKHKTVTVIDCSKASLDLITKYIRSLCTPNHLIIADSTCKLIAEYCLYDMTRISGEADKLISYKLGKDVIENEDVNLLVTKSSDYKIYEMVSYIANKNFAAAYDVLNDLNSVADKQVLFASLYYHFRRMFFAAMSDKNDAQLADLLGVKEFAVTMARRQAKSFSVKRIKKIMDKLSQCERAFKTGTMTFDGAFLSGVFNVLCE